MEKKNGLYVLELNDIINNSEIEETDLFDWGRENYMKHVHVICRKVMNVLYSAYHGINPERQKVIVDYFIDNSADKQNALMFAQIEYLRAALTTGLDIKEYESGMLEYQDSLIQELRNGGLWYASEIVYEDSDLE